MRRQHIRVGGKDGGSWSTIAKGVAIPEALSEEACGSRLDKWTARGALLIVQANSVERVMRDGWPNRIIAKAPDPGDLLLPLELERVQDRLSRCREMIEVLGGATIDATTTPEGGAS